MLAKTKRLPEVAQKTSAKKLPEFDSHEFVMTLRDEPSGLHAFIAVHNTNLGDSALGGTRFTNYASEKDALQDVLNLSKAMSYKCALAQLPYGGSKGVIIARPELDRLKSLEAYARLVEKLRGLFKTGTDVGVSDQDVKFMAQHTSHMLGVTPGDRGELTTSDMAALGVFQAMKACLKQLYGSSDFRGRTVAIKGVGKLGGELAHLIIKAGGSVLVSDIDTDKPHSLQKRQPRTKAVDNRKIHEQEVDIYAPCALGNELTKENSLRLRCKAIAGGANNQLADDAIGELLYRRDILYAPDYIANAGGLIYVADELELGGFKRSRVLKRTRAIENTVNAIFRQAAEQKLPTYKVANTIARTRIRNGIKNG